MITFKEFINENIKKHMKAEAESIMKDEQYKNKTEINAGSCFDFAFGTIQRMKSDGIKGMKLIRKPDHTWIKYKNKHYDVEHMNGVSDPKKLNFFKNKK